MSTAVFTLGVSTVNVDALPETIQLDFTGPSAIAPISVPAGSTSATVANITVGGTYNYTITNLDAKGTPVANLGTPYPTVTGSFTVAPIQLTGVIAVNATVVLS
jgi:hypothetical protein